MRKHAQALAVHADRRDLGARHHLYAVGGRIGQLGRGDRLDLRHDDVRVHVVEQRAQLSGVGHIEHARLMRHLLRRRARV